MEKATLEKGDSGSDQSPPLPGYHEEAPYEKRNSLDVINREVPDPDEGLSEEERKKIVSHDKIFINSCG